MKKIYIFFVLVVLFGLGSDIVALAQTTTFSETGSVQTYTVPAGATAITVDAYGAQGGGIQCGGAEEYQSKGGCGGRVKATISVTPGHVLNIVVGGHGGVVSGTLSSGAAGYGGGGADAYYNTTWPSAGGGGGSFIIDATAGDTLLVAGGGGGGGGDFCSTSFSGSYGDNGGAGGGSTGGAGNANLCGTGAGGKGGTQTAGGAGSTCSSYTGAAGGFGHGGSSPATGTAGEPSGGGGGGRYGGGSGADGSGGGGGSSYINSLYLVAIIDTVQGANCPVSPSTTPVNGSVTISVACSPGIITGADSVCTGSTITLTDTASGGTWSVTNPTFATISATGEVTALSPGTDTVEYTVTGCFALLPLAVDLTPTVAVSGAATICYGGSTNINFTGTPGATVSYNINGGATLTETIGAGGTATVGTGVLDSNVTYGLLSVSNGSCTTPASGSVLISVLPVAHTITGDSAVCAGLTTVLADTPSGGTWSDAGTGFATINPISGVAAGISAGTETITYTAPTSGCVSTTTLTINPSPAAITGSVSAVCVGSYLSLSVTPTTGGTWSTSPTAFATIDSLGGTLYGTSAGTTVVTYTLPPGGCTSTYTVTVNGLPSITGADSVCVGSSITLTGTPASGSWTSGSPDTASVTISGGSVSGVAAGTAKITYTLGTGCMTDTTILVNPTPVAITGGTAVCAGSALALADSPSGGTWSASPASFATIDPVSGVLTALSAGTELVTYSLPPGGCTSTLAITVNPLPAAITGADSVCVGLTTALVSGPTGGTWTSIPAATATVSATGVVRGISQGIADITYTLGTGCQQSYSVTVNPLPAAISGASAVCSGLSVVLSDDSLGGSWSVSPATVATITASGDLTGGTAGAATVVYTLPTGCIATDIVTVNPLPAPITGSSSVCYGLTTTLGETTPGGTWSSSDTLVASINAGGTVTGVAVGTATITYTLGTGCIETFTMTVNPLPDAILGASAVCVDGSITMSDLSAPGTWSTSPASVATITPTTGVLTGVLSGTVSVIFTLPTTCQITTTVTVNPLPAAIGGSLATCEDGGTTTLTDITMPGTWSISPASLATVDSTTGVVTGISAGLATVTYTLPFTGCYVAETFTVNPLPLPISGDTYCMRKRHGDTS